MGAGAAALDALIDPDAATNVLVVNCGSNDIAADQRNATGEQAAADLAAYCADRQTAGWTVVVTTVLPRTSTGVGANYETRRTTLNTAIRADWATYADALADTAADTTIGDATDSDNTTYYSDKVHLTFAGRHIAGPIIAAAIESVT